MAGAPYQDDRCTCCDDSSGIVGSDSRKAADGEDPRLDDDKITEVPDHTDDSSEDIGHDTLTVDVEVNTEAARDAIAALQQDVERLTEDINKAVDRLQELDGAASIDYGSHAPGPSAVREELGLPDDSSEDGTDDEYEITWGNRGDDERIPIGETPTIPNFYDCQLTREIHRTRYMTVYEDSDGDPWIELRSGGLYPVDMSAPHIIEALDTNDEWVRRETLDE